MKPNQIVLDIEVKTAGHYVVQPNSFATLFLLGGFVHLPRYQKPPYSWKEHRDWVISNTSQEGIGRRGVSTGWQHQVYVVNTTHAPTAMYEHPYVCRGLMPFGHEKEGVLFHKGFICAGRPGNNSYYTAFRPEDNAEKSVDLIHEEMFGAKLYFLDKARVGKNRSSVSSDGIDIMLTVRVRDDEVIGFRSMVRTNAYVTGGHGSYTTCDLSYRGYEKDMGDWKVERYAEDRFERSWNSQVSLASEAMYHNSIHLLVYRFVTKIDK
jgi:hypothetical protein